MLIEQSTEAGPPATAETTRITRTRFELRPRDGQPPIRGDLRVAEDARPKSLVVMCHGFKGFRTFGAWPAMARALAARGHAAVNFDFSRNGVGPDGVDFSALDLFRENTHSLNVQEIRMVLDALTAAGFWSASRSASGCSATRAAAARPSWPRRRMTASDRWSPGPPSPTSPGAGRRRTSRSGAPTRRWTSPTAARGR